jgi:hypothetical protein
MSDSDDNIVTKYSFGRELAREWVRDHPVKGGAWPTAHKGHRIETQGQASVTSAKAFIDENRLDREVIKEHCNVLGVQPLKFDGVGWFKFSTSGVRAPFVGVLEGNHVIDLVAWPPDRPNEIALHEGRGVLLGYEQLISAASWALDGKLMIHRSVLRWLRARCQGIVPLTPGAFDVIRREALGDLECEDEEHAETLHILLNPKPFAFKLWVNHD